MKIVQFKVMKSLGSHLAKVGGVVNIMCDDEGTPLDEGWRRRVKDSKLDGCLVVVDESTPIKEDEPEPEHEEVRVKQKKNKPRKKDEDSESVDTDN